MQEIDYDNANESPRSPVTLDACATSAAAGIRTYRWTFANGDPPVSTTACRATWKRPLSEEFAQTSVTLTVTANDGTTATTHPVHRVPRPRNRLPGRLRGVGRRSTRGWADVARGVLRSVGVGSGGAGQPATAAVTAEHDRSPVGPDLRGRFDNVGRLSAVVGQEALRLVVLRRPARSVSWHLRPRPPAAAVEPPSGAAGPEWSVGRQVADDNRSQRHALVHCARLVPARWAGGPDRDRAEGVHSQERHQD